MIALAISESAKVLANPVYKGPHKSSGINYNKHSYDISNTIDLLAGSGHNPVP